MLDILLNGDHHVSTFHPEHLRVRSRSFGASTPFSHHSSLFPSNVVQIEHDGNILVILSKPDQLIYFDVKTFQPIHSFYSPSDIPSPCSITSFVLHSQPSSEKNPDSPFNHCKRFVIAAAYSTGHLVAWNGETADLLFVCSVYSNLPCFLWQSSSRVLASNDVGLIHVWNSIELCTASPSCVFSIGARLLSLSQLDLKEHPLLMVSYESIFSTDSCVVAVYSLISGRCLRKINEKSIVTHMNAFATDRGLALVGYTRSMTDSEIKIRVWERFLVDSDSVENTTRSFLTSKTLKPEPSPMYLHFDGIEGLWFFSRNGMTIILHCHQHCNIPWVSDNDTSLLASHQSCAHDFPVKHPLFCNEWINQFKQIFI
eukprot:Sdes_comp14941_c0_seq1m3649